MSSPSSFSVQASYLKIRETVDLGASNALPTESAISASTESLSKKLPIEGLGDEATLTHLLQDITLGFNGPKTSANYYGFVTGGVLPIAEVADNIVTAWDQNVQVHLPTQSVSTAVEDRALSMLVELLTLGDDWKGRTFTTGATASNILGLACGREAVLRRRLALKREQESGDNSISIGELGILEACQMAEVDSFQVLTTMGHSSLYKASSIVGLGRKSVKDVGLKGEPWRFDMSALEKSLGKDRTASIVVVSCGEVNTGRFATSGLDEMTLLRNLCDKYGAWLHVDGAFGLFSRALPDTSEFTELHRACSGIELADSITGDAHKCLNVPYDCGFFLTHSATILPQIFQNPNAAYLTAAASSIPSPLNIGIENSRRLRALPAYAVLLSHGRTGLGAIFTRQVQLARAAAAFLRSHSQFELLPETESDSDIGIIVLFRARDKSINDTLVQRVNASKRIYVSGTSWDGAPACRIAVSTWRVDVERDLGIIREVLEDALL